MIKTTVSIEWKDKSLNLNIYQDKIGNVHKYEESTQELIMDVLHRLTNTMQEAFERANLPWYKKIF